MLLRFIRKQRFLEPPLPQRCLEEGSKNQGKYNEKAKNLNGFDFANLQEQDKLHCTK